MKKSHNYVDNQEFSDAIVEYVKTRQQAERDGLPIPQITDYIATCLLSIARGLASKGNFMSYTFRDEMVMDAVENCLKAVKNYDVDAPTRTGKPNPFAYFTQITYYAFLRRIAKEKQHHNLRFKLIEKSGLDQFLVDDDATHHISNNLVENIKVKLDALRQEDSYIDSYFEEQNKK